MIFNSTRDTSHQTNFQQAIFTGLCADGGLYHPVEFNDFSESIAAFSPEHSFLHIASTMTRNLLSDELSNSESDNICRNAFSFSPQLTRISDSIHILELFHGPSFAFKDFGASFLSLSIEHFLEESNNRAIILTATSGDTGSAVAQAFYEKHNIDVIILYPSGRVSPLQEKQLTTLNKNVHALEVKGSFDDCQRMVKEAFLDSTLKEQFCLTSANSINLGRLIPQSFYYLWAHAQMNSHPYRFCVPSGNFGNLTAGLYAWKWGMNCSGFIAATNINDVVPEYLQTGTYNPRASVHTYSNAMDVGAPSNFERMLSLFENDYKNMGSVIKQNVITDTETLNTIRQIHDSTGIVVDPHTAVGILAAERLSSSDSQEKTIVLSTAHPGKFGEIVEKALGFQPDIPAELQSLLEKPKQSVIIENNVQELKNFLNTRFTF